MLIEKGCYLKNRDYLIVLSGRKDIGMDDLVSIIVPVYNVQDYLDKCISSILAQTYINLEIIIIDDGSTDKSGEIGDKYAAKDSRVAVYHKYNGGLSSARNYGIEKAKGNYITFIDSDDSVNRNYIAKLMEGCNHSTISVCSYRKVSETEVPDLNEIYSGNKEEMEPDTAIVRFFNDNTFVSACGKLFPKAFFEDVRFPEGKIYEDFATIYKLYAKSAKIIFSQAEYYYYTMRTNSITNAPFSKKNLDMFDVVESIEVDIKHRGFEKHIVEAFWGCKARCFLLLYHKINAASDTALYRDVQVEITNYINDKKYSILFSRNVGYKIKLAMLVFCANRKMFGIMMNSLQA